MPTEIADLETLLPALVYEIAAEVGEPFIEEAASLLWHRRLEAMAEEVVGATRDERDELSAMVAPLTVVVSPLSNDDWSDPLSVEEVLFGVRAKRRRWGIRPLQPVWIC